MRRARLGLLVNPVAGLGGAVGLKGSDGAAVQAQARALGGSSAAAARSHEALAAFADGDREIVTAGHAMGEDLCRARGLPHTVAARFGPETTGRDTARGAAALSAAGVDLILFAGGDGTARDVADGAGRTPVLGVPAGVKMYSGVFAATPILAGRLAAQFLATAPPLRRTSEVELVDIDEAGLRRDEPSIRLYGTALVPASPAVARAKASLPADDDEQVAALCRDLAAQLEPDRVTIVGPGRTTRLFMASCGCPKTLLGVDAMLGRALLAADCGERQILSLIEGRRAQLVVGLLGGQGCLFGRGNQPISSRVLRRIGLDRLLVLAGAAKLASLPQGLFADTGDADLDRRLEGFIRIHTAPRRSTLLRVRVPSLAG